MGLAVGKNKENGTKENEKHLSRAQSKADSNFTPDKRNKNQQLLHSNSVVLTNDIENDNDPTIKEKVRGKTNSKEENGIDNSDQTNDNDGVKQEQNDRNDRTEENNDAGAVDIGDGLTIALPQQSTERLDIDKRSPNQIIKDEKEREDKERLLKEKKEKQEKVDKEKAKKWKQSLETSLREKISSLKKKYEDGDMKFSLLEKALRQINTGQQKKDSSNTELFVLDKDQQKQTKLRSVREEKANLLHRLSEIASARLRHNNPDIADLSDENRATKLAEKLSELYDNEWTDLFEATKTKAGKSVNERTVAECLRDILKFCYEKCQCIANNQLVSLSSCLHMGTDPIDLQSSPPELRLRLKEFQKHTSHYSVQHIQTSVSKVVAKSTYKELKENIVVKCSMKTKKQYNLYINLCTEITWYMQIQDPPVVLDFGTESVDISRFRPYTASGPFLDYVLWPAMLLHNNGPIVAKGVAQFKKNKEANETKSA